jgi:predicted transcriptional regulator of viral defense system
MNDDRRANELATRILAFTSRAQERVFTTREITEAMAVAPGEVIPALERLQREGQIERVRDGHSLDESSWRRTRSAGGHPRG